MNWVRQRKHPTSLKLPSHAEQLIDIDFLRPLCAHYATSERRMEGKRRKRHSTMGCFFTKSAVRQAFLRAARCTRWNSTRTVSSRAMTVVAAAAYSSSRWELVPTRAPGIVINHWKHIRLYSRSCLSSGVFGCRSSDQSVQKLCATRTLYGPSCLSSEHDG